MKSVDVESLGAAEKKTADLLNQLHLNDFPLYLRPTKNEIVVMYSYKWKVQ